MVTFSKRAREPWHRRFARGHAPGDAAILYGGGAILVLAVGGFWAFATSVHPDVWVPVLLLITLTMISLPICVMSAGRPTDSRLLRILVLAFSLKMLAVFPRYMVNEYVYEGEADTGLYYQAGVQFVENMSERQEWSLSGSALDKYTDETRMIGYFGGVMYLVTGTTYLGSYIAFTWVSWVGLLLFFRAFRIAYPNAPPYLAAALIFFLPSMLYWPSAVGKDPVMLLTLGMVTLGIARILNMDRPFRGVVLLVPAAWLMMQVRPHLLIICLVGVAASLLARRPAQHSAARAVGVRLALLIALIPGLAFGMARMDEAFGDPNEGSISVTAVLEKTNEQTAIGNSTFETRPVSNPVDLLPATVSVLYRPFPFEVNSLPVFISALEGTALLLLTFAAARWIWKVVPMMYRDPFAAFCGGYCLAFIFAFSNVGNAGILSRQRVQLFPIMVLLIAATHDRYRSLTDAADAESPATLPVGQPPNHPTDLVLAESHS